jgi:tRNA threonylcarbamoyladenosine biosynthesis protein TsaB
VAYLYLDTTDHLIVGLLDKSYKWIGYIEDETKKSSSIIHKLIHELLKDSNLETENIAGIFQSAGPGSYTGMRISEGISQIMEWQSVDVFSFYHFEVPSLLGIDKGIWIANGFKGEIFLYSFNGELNSKRLLCAEEFNNLIKEDNLKEVYTNFISEDFKIDKIKMIATGNLLKENSEQFFKTVKKREIRLGPYYYRSESKEFKVR